MDYINSTNIQKLRKSRNLTLTELASRLNDRYKKFGLNFSKASIDRWEKGTSSPSIDHASALADYFGVTLDELSNRIQSEHEPDTIAAHIDEDVTEEEMKEIRKYIEFIKSQRK